MRIALIEFPGSTCSRETSLAVARAGMIPVPFLWNEAVDNLADFSGYILVGGFSYEDRSRAGIIAALHPLMAILKKETIKGKPLLGICNGAQILVESGLVPGLTDYQLAMALTPNKRRFENKALGSGFYNAWVNICLTKEFSQGAFTRKLKVGQTLKIPIAHGEGRFQLSADLWAVLKKEGCISFHYCNDRGIIDKHYPINPNGSVYNLAAISNAAGNVLAMMPHPERTPDGDFIFQSMRDYIAEKSYSEVKPITYRYLSYLPSIYHYPKPAKEVLIAPLITDNQSLTLEKIVLVQGIKVSIKRYIHWEIHSSTAAYREIMRSPLLFNSNKEQWIEDPQNLKSPISFLIQAKEDLVGEGKKQQCQKSLGLRVEKLKLSVLWLIDCAEEKREEVVDYLLGAALLFNPHADNCYYYYF